MKYLHKSSHVAHIISAPIIWSLIIPFIFLDICVEIYHHICFPLYELPLVKRSKYIIFDRYKLDYINGLQKTNCTYCAYVNGLLRYITEIGAETEHYWCAIRHAKKDAVYPDHHKDFIPYGDKTAYQQVYVKPQQQKIENVHKK
jgi:hypothetical protein